MAKTTNNKKQPPKSSNPTKKNTKNNKNTHLSNNSLSIEITAILIICISVLLIISVFFSGGGFLGAFLSKFLKGLFGIGAYLLPIIMIVSCIIIFFSQAKKINIFKLSLTLIIFALVIALFHIINRGNIDSFANYGVYLLDQYNTGGFIDGGFFGAIFGDIFLKIMGTFTSYIVITIIIIGCSFLLMGKSFFTTMSRFIKNMSNYFYYEYSVKEDEPEEDINLEPRESIFSKMKNYFSNKKSNKNYDNDYYDDYYDDNRENYYRDSSIREKRQPEYNNIGKNNKVFKQYNNYVYDGFDKYRKVEKPVFFNMPNQSQPPVDKKIIFAMDEIDNPEKYAKQETKVPSFLQKNNSINNAINTDNSVNTNNDFNIHYNDGQSLLPQENIEENAYSSIHNMVENYEKEQDLFKVKSKEEYINEVYKKKTTSVANFNVEKREFDLELNLSNKKNIEDIFDNPPEEFLPENSNDSFEDLDQFYDFNNHMADETLDNPFVEIPMQEVANDFDDFENYHIADKTEQQPIAEDNIKNNIADNNTEKSSLNNTNFGNNANAGVPIPKANVGADGYVEIKQNNNIPNIPKEPPLNNQNVQDPVIIKAEKEKMVTEPVLQVPLKKEYIFPKLNFLSKNPDIQKDDNDMELRENSNILVKTLKSFNVTAQVINISKGPSVTRYELSIEDGIKVSKILGLADNLALSLAASSVRIEAPIPGKSAVGIEIPNKEVKSVFLSEVVCAEKFQKFPSKVAFGLGKDITGNVIVTDIAKMPHMLIAGATGSGKSVCINTLITSILYKSSPDEVKLMMIDPKVVELSVYNGIPHLLTPVVTDPEKAAGVLNWAVAEMMERYNLFAQTGTRNLVGFNEIKVKNGEEKLPQIVIIIDELADLMMVAAKEVEASICRLAQLARAAGIHLIIATQRPSVDVITGLIKANIPSRIAFAVSSGTDSRTVLDTVGAERLLGKGDMLFRSVDMNKPLRIQGAFVSDSEVEHIVSFIKEHSQANYDENIINKIENSSKSNANSGSDSSDELTEEIISFLVRKGKASTSMIQRQFRIGYNRAARIIEELEDRGIISAENGSKQRDVLMDRYQYEEYQDRYDKY